MARDESTEARTAGENAPYTPAYANYVLVMLFIVYVFNFIDRQIMSVFIGPIKAEFGVSDTAMGLLVGFAFTLLYTFAGIPIARLADRSNRRNIVVIGLALWSAMTVASGLAKNFVQLVIARICVGIGEAAGSPPSHSLIADYFPQNKRATALAIYVSGVFVGSGIAYLGGGYLREFFDWRTAFIVLGAPGLLVALIVWLTVKEPERGVSDQREADTETATLGETLSHLLHSRSWVLLMIGFSLMSVTGYAVLMWGFEFFGRVHGMSSITIGQWMGVIVGVGGCVGSIFGGRLSDRMTETRVTRSVSVPVLATLAGIPLGLVFLLAESQTMSLWCFFPFYVLINVYIPAMYSTNQALSKLRMRATAAAIMLFIVNIVGAGAGPFLVGLLSDLFAPAYGVLSIRYALVVAVLCGGVGCVLILLSTKTLESDLQRVRGPSP